MAMYRFRNNYTLYREFQWRLLLLLFLIRRNPPRPHSRFVVYVLFSNSSGLNTVKFEVEKKNSDSPL